MAEKLLEEHAAVAEASQGTKVHATASLILAPKYASAVSFIFNRIMEEISSGWNFFSCTTGKIENMNCELVA